MRKFIQALMGVFALAMTSVPSAASAQDASGRSTLVEEVPGVTLTQQEYAELWSNGCVVGPTATVAPLLAKMERKGVQNCSPKFYSQLDNSNKEGSMIWWAVRTPDGISVCDSLKGINVANNRLSCRNYSMAAAANGQPRFADSNYHINGGTIMAQTLGSLASTLVAGPLTAATGQLLAPSCKNCNNGPSVVNVNNLEALSQAISSSELNQVTSGGTGPCTTCGSKPPASHGQNGSGSN